MKFPKPGKRKSSKIQTARKKARKWFQMYIRLTYAWPESGLVRCFTCGSVGHYKKMDGGHFIPAQYNSHCFNEKNVHPQETNCNKFLGGNQLVYARKIDEKYGKGTAKQMEATKSKNRPNYGVFEYEQIAKVYKDKCDKLKIEKGL
jgi:hypothetical protein